MMRMMLLWPAAAAILGATTFTVWLRATVAPDVALRLPVKPEQKRLKKSIKSRNLGTLIHGDGKPSKLRGSWPQFRGSDRSNIVRDAAGLARSWPAEGPRVLWRLRLGEGYAGAAVHKGCAYIIDYDQKKLEDAIRCLSLDDGREVWRYTYYVKVKRNHGMSRTTPAVNDNYVVTIGPKCHLTCLDAKTGERKWHFDMVEKFGTVVPPWYAGQCPLIDRDAAIIAPGADPLMMAVDLATGKIRWRTPNPGGWGMTHSSIAAIDFQGARQYVYCTTKGVVGVSAADGKLLWTKPDWRIQQANVPTPLVVGHDRIFFCGGYNAGCVMVRLKQTNGRIETEEVFRRKHTVFGAIQQTPILYQGHIYGVDPKGQLVCLDLEGNRVWSSGAAHRFGLGPYLIADGLIFILQGRRATLHLVDASPSGYTELAQAKLLDGHDAWAPMAMASGRLLLRDLTEMVCVQVPQEEP